MAVHLKQVGGGAITVNFVYNEVPSGTINGTNTVFTLAHSPINGTVRVFLNGVLQEPGAGLDYTISGSTITFVKAPRSKMNIIAHYIKNV